MIKLQNNSQITRDHFTSYFSYFVIESIIEGNTHAEVYVDRIENPQITIVWDTKYGISCGGSSDRENLLKAIEFIKECILTSDIRQDRGIIKVMFENEDWKEAILEGVREFNHNIYPRSIYRHKLEYIPSLHCKDSSIKIRKIEDVILSDGKLKNHEGLTEELIQMWGSTRNFLSKGFGFCALKGECIAAWCTGEYFSKNWCGIGIETYEEFQRQGIATSATIEIVKYCKEMNKIPHWDCWKNNIPSAKTAEKSGFEKLMDYEIVFLKFI